MAATGSNVKAKFCVDIPVGSIGLVRFHIVDLLAGYDKVPALLGNDALRGRGYSINYDERFFTLGGHQHAFVWRGSIPMYDLLPQGEHV